MTFIFCTSCSTKVIESVKVCPSCGNKSFTKSLNNSPTNTLTKNLTHPSPSQQSSTVSSSKTWSWDWLWQAIAITLIVKVFGPAGGVTAVLVYLWQQPKLGKWPAMGVAAVAGIAVPLLILAFIRN